jgi:cytidylate kinase
MKTSASLQQFIEERKRMDRHHGHYPFVTISREAGAGGHTVAEHILRALNESAYTDLARGWKIFDRELCEEVVNDPELNVPLESLVTEEYHTQLEEFANDLLGQRTPQFSVYRRIIRLVRLLASLGKVILVGRGGGFATANLPAGVHIRLIAPPAVRVERMARYLKVSPAQARPLIEKQDRDRARYISDFFGKDIADPLAYDAVFNTGSVPVEDVAAATVRLIASRARLPTLAG